MESVERVTNAKKNAVVARFAASKKKTIPRTRTVSSTEEEIRCLTGMSQLDTIEGLRATLAETIAGLPEVLRSCSVETLVNDIAPIFADGDYAR